MRSVQRNYNGDIKLNLKESVRTLWFKHIRLRFANIHKCHNCGSKYKLVDDNSECGDCGIGSTCMKIFSTKCGFQEECAGKLLQNGQCKMCEQYTDLEYLHALIYQEVHGKLYYFFSHFKFNKHDQWIGHYYKDIHAGCDENRPVICKDHYICIIPCIVINWIGSKE